MIDGKVTKNRGAGTPIQGHSEAGRISGGSVLAVVLSIGGFPSSCRPTSVRMRTAVGGRLTFGPGVNGGAVIATVSD